MPDTISDLWEKFERWARRFRKAAAQGDMALITGWRPALTARLAEKQARKKISFLRGYFVDLSFDGAGYMGDRMQILRWQFPSKQDSAFAIRLAQDTRHNLREGASFHFKGKQMILFARDVGHIDYPSITGVLPFDRIHIRRPRYAPWEAGLAKEVVKIIHEDLEGDAYYCRIKTRMAKNVLCLEIEWN